MIEIKPCPHCKSKNVNISHHEWQVECSDCFMRGPRDTNEHDAIVHWNIIAVAGDEWEEWEREAGQLQSKLCSCEYDKGEVVAMLRAIVILPEAMREDSIADAKQLLIKLGVKF